MVCNILSLLLLHDADCLFVRNILALSGVKQFCADDSRRPSFDWRVLSKRASLDRCRAGLISDAQTAFMDTCDQTMLGGHCLQAVRAVQSAKALGRMEMSHRRLPWAMNGMAIKGMACLKIRLSNRPSNARHESLDYTLHQLQPDQLAETRVFRRSSFERRLASQRQISLLHGTIGTVLVVPLPLPFADPVNYSKRRRHA